MRKPSRPPEIRRAVPPDARTATWRDTVVFRTPHGIWHHTLAEQVPMSFPWVAMCSADPRGTDPKSRNGTSHRPFWDRLERDLYVVHEQAVPGRVFQEAADLPLRKGRVQYNRPLWLVVERAKETIRVLALQDYPWRDPELLDRILAGRPVDQEGAARAAKAASRASAALDGLTPSERRLAVAALAR